MSLDNRIRDFIVKDRIYVLMLIFIIVTNVFFTAFPVKEKKKHLPDKKIGRLMSREEIIAQEKHIREILEQDKVLASVLSSVFFLTALVLLWGLIMGIRCLALKLNGRDLMVAYGSPPDIGWGVADIIRLIIAFYFIGYLMQFLEAGVLHAAGIKKPDEKLLTVLNATVMDAIGIAVIMYFVIIKFRKKIANLGVSFKNILRDIKIGVAGYITLLPVLALIMIIVLSILQVIRFEQPESPALEILYEDSRPKLLLVLTVLVTFLGPIAEELFFRGFAYTVLRKKIGIKGAMILVSAVFAMLHMNAIAFFPILALGMLLAYLYEKTGSLIPSISVHIIHNSAVIFFVYLYKIIALPK